MSSVVVSNTPIEEFGGHDVISSSEKWQTIDPNNPAWTGGGQPYPIARHEVEEKRQVNAPVKTDNGASY